MRNFFEKVRKARLKRYLVGDYTKELESRYWALQEEYTALEQRMNSIVKQLRQENENLKLELKEVMNNS